MNPLLKAGAFLVPVLLIAVLAILTEEPEDAEDPCANLDSDVAAAILADSAHDQDGLANRAILQRGRCQQPKPENANQSGAESGNALAADSSTDAANPASTKADTPAAQMEQGAAPEQASPAGARDRDGQQDMPTEDASGNAAQITPLSSTKTAANPAHQATPHAAAPPVTVPTGTASEIVQHRCMVCHGCYDAPCQLKLEAQAGLERGASKDLVYNGGRLMEANMTRLFDDALSERGWRKKGFYPVVDKEQPEQGVMYRLLELKQAHPLPTDGPMPEGFDFSLARDQQCPKQDEFDSYAEDKPLWGMPYGLPGLNQEQHRTLTSWLDDGAPAPALATLSAAQQQLVTDWETFLNGDTPKQRLMARYVYEHLFLASLYLEAGEQPAWFRLVRSRTEPGKPLDLIATRRPYDDPGVKRVYYRLQRMPVQALAKTHMAYRFDQARMDWYRDLFLEPAYEVPSLPGYEREVASNPFKSFVDIPLPSRYRFLLEEARFTIMNFIKGPVCRGQIALNVIDDHFWVVFADPNRMNMDVDARFLSSEMDKMRLPTPATGTVIDLFSWARYAKAHEKYQRARSRFIRKRSQQGERLNLDSLWDGDGYNANASLTIFRHFDTASVEMGLLGAVPKTAWVIDYPLLERIHYLLVAGFDVYGAVSHQLESRLYMDFLRMEGEFNFLLFMPPEQRLPMWDYWYRDAPKGAREHFIGRSALASETTDIKYETDNPKAELLLALRERIHGAKAEKFDYRRPEDKDIAAQLAAIESRVGAHNSFMPDVSFVNVIGPRRDRFYTLISNSAHSNIAQLFREDKRRLPAEDSMSIVRGFIGAYPNYFFQVEVKELPQFASDIAALGSADDYRKFRARYGVARNASWFWRFADKAHARYQWLDPVEFGLFDLNRYDGY